MNEVNEIDDIAKGCSDRGELAVKIEKVIHDGDIVKYKCNERSHNACIIDASTSFDEEESRAFLTSIKLNNPPNPVFVGKLDEAITELSVEVASHYQGKFDE